MIDKVVHNWIHSCHVPIPDGQNPSSKMQGETSAI
jgi:hypothetical protein